MLAIKIYSILVNSMPDERTGSRMTWLNSPLRSQQDIWTLSNMIQVGQWYGTHAVSPTTLFINFPLYDAEQKTTSGQQRAKRKPTVAFLDIETEIYGKGKGRADEGSLEIEDPIDAVDALESEPDSADYDDEAADFQVDEDINLSSGTLISLLSMDTPLPEGSSSSRRTGASSSEVATEVDWDF
jgi:hypothetical protein